MNKPLIGMGDKRAHVLVYIANRPAMDQYIGLTDLLPLVNTQIDSINQACGNGWRKVFNVYAKVLFALPSEYYSFAKHAKSWQEFRDNYLLQANSNTALLFSRPDFTKKNCLHIITGRTYAKEMINVGALDCQLEWLDDEFAIDKAKKLIVCPYFDYRQLSNIKIARLSQLVAQLWS